MKTALEMLNEDMFGKKRYFNKSDMDMGFFISPGGKLYRLEGSGRHISMIENDPELFGMTEQEIKDIYDSFEEKYGIEGKAREQIIKTVVKKGWLRVRRYLVRGAYMWTVNAPKINETIASRIYDFFEKYFDDCKGEYNYVGDDVYVDTENGRDKYSVSDILKFKLWKDHALYEACMKSLNKNRILW